MRNYSSSTNEFKLLQKSLSVIEKTVVNLRKQENVYLNYLIEKLDGWYDVTPHQTEFTELELCYQLFTELFGRYSASFFSNDFIRYALSGSEDQHGELQVNGKMLFLTALRSYLCTSQDMQSLKFLLLE